MKKNSDSDYHCSYYRYHCWSQHPTPHPASHHNYGSQITRYPTTTTDYRNDHC